MATWLPRRNKLSRRTMLRGLFAGTAVAVGLPALEIFLNDHGTAYADCPTTGPNGLPLVFGTFYWGNGMIPTRWTPGATGAAYGSALSPMLARLKASDGATGDNWDLTSKIAVLTGLRVLTSNTSPHGSGPAGLFSGADLVDDTFVGPSFDQVIASAFAMNDAPRRFQSIEFGVQRSDTCWSMTGPHAVNPPECDPFNLYTTIFGPEFRPPGDNSPPPPQIGLRHSVLDAVGGQVQRLQTRLGTADRARLDEHLTGIRALESQLDLLAMGTNACACTVPTDMPMTSYPDVDGRPQMQAIHRVMTDLVVHALSCDQTRVFFEAFSQPVNNTLFLNEPSGHHQLTHDEPDGMVNGGVTQPHVEEIVTFILGEFAYLVNRLATYQEGAQTLLDRCAILGTSDVSYGRTHSLDDYPILLAGTLNGQLAPTNYHYASSGENASSLMLTLQNVFMAGDGTYGRGAAHTSQELSVLRAGMT